MVHSGRLGNPRGAAGGAVGIVVMAVLAVAPALACTPTANIQVNPNRADPGTTVVVDGAVFQPAGEQVTVRWGGTNGEVLGRAAVDDSGQFRFSFTVPPAAAGHYIIAASQPVADGGYKRSAATLEVLGRPRQEQAPPPQQPSEQPSPSPSSSSTGQPPPQQTSGQPSQTEATATPDRSSGSAGAPAAPARSQAPVGASPSPGPQSPASLSSGTAPGGAAALPEPAPASEPVQPAAPTDEPTPGAPAAAATNDVWSGFRIDGSPWLRPGVPETARSDEPTDPALLVGLALVGVGVVLLSATGVTAVLARRRAVAPTGDGQEGSR